MKIKIFPARVRKLNRKKSEQLEIALLNAPRVPIARLHEEARQFERMMIARRSAKDCL